MSFFKSRALTERFKMNKEFNKTTKDVNALLKKLTPEVQDSANAAEYSKFLNKTLEKAKTFDKSDATYVNYVTKAMKPKVAAKPVDADKATPKRKAVALADGKEDKEKEKDTKKVKKAAEK